MPKIKIRKPGKQITIGADPELFAFDENANPVSVHDVLPGTKASPVKVPFGGIQVDGIAGEFNIEPAKSRSEFLKNIHHVRNLLNFFLSQKKPGWHFQAVPTVHLGQNFLENLPKDVRALGCEPDYNAYTGEVNPKPDGNVLFRTGSGHVHVGWGQGFDPFEEKHFKTCCNLTKEFDFVLFKASHKWDTDTTRMKLYGKPGAFRPKPYGMEYRVLSNAWLDQSILQQYVYDATRAVAEQFFKGVELRDRFEKMCTFWPDDIVNDRYKKFLEANHIPDIDNYAFTGVE